MQLKHKLRHKLKKFTAITLSCLSVISTPLTAYAVGGNTGAGDNEGIHGGYGSDMGSNRPNSRLGFRVSLVDRNDPTKVISVNDAGEPVVIDFLLTSEEKFTYYTGYDKKLNPVGSVQSGPEQNQPSNTSGTGLSYKDYGITEDDIKELADMMGAGTNKYGGLTSHR